jgi:hypothetical protein
MGDQKVDGGEVGEEDPGRWRWRWWRRTWDSGAVEAARGIRHEWLWYSPAGGAQSGMCTRSAPGSSHGRTNRAGGARRRGQNPLGLGFRAADWATPLHAYEIHSSEEILRRSQRDAVVAAGDLCVVVEASTCVEHDWFTLQ